jgi:hypothetical protein
MKVHMKDIRLRNNAGMDFPVCYAGGGKQGLLDLDKTHLPTTGRLDECTCERCKRIFPVRYPWATGR